VFLGAHVILHLPKAATLFLVRREHRGRNAVDVQSLARMTFFTSG
jgi:hypothetical protein